MSVTGEKLAEGLFQNNLMDLINLQKNDVINKACALFLQGNYQEAEDVLLNLYPETYFNEDAPALIMMGHIQMRLEQYESAIEYFRQAMKCENSFGDFIYDSIGISYFIKNEYNIAIENFEEARNFSQNNFNYHYHVALCYETMLNARTEQEMKADEDKNNTSVIKMAEIKQLREKIKEAYTDALQINQNSYEVLLNLGTINANEGLTSVAEKYYKRALQANGNDWRIYINLAYLTMIEKEYKIARDYFEKGISILGEEVDLKILITYMTALHKTESWKNLEIIAKKVLKIDKKNKKALVYLLTALNKNRKYNQLIYLYKKLKTKLKKVKTDYSIDEKNNENQLSLHYDSIKKKLKHGLKEAKKGAKQLRENAAAKEKNADRLSDYSYIAKLDIDNINSFGFNEAEIKNLLQIYKKDENNVEALYHLGMINFKEEDFPKAEEFFLKVRDLNPNYQRPQVCACLGDINLLVYKKPKEAIEYFEKSVDGGNNELLQVKMGICYELMDNNKKALEYYKEGYELNKEFPSSIFHIGCILDKNDDPEARTWFEMAYEKEKENVEYLRKFGDILVRSNVEDDVKKGILILEKGLEFFTGNVDIMSSLAIGYEKQGRLKEAINLLEHANNDASFFNNKSKIFQLASYYEKAKNFTKAVEHFKNVLILEKNNIEALLHMGFIYKSCKEFVKSYKCFNRIIESEPNNVHANYGLGRLYQLMNDKDDEAIQYYLKCVQIDPNYIKANLQLGVLYLKLKKLDESFKYLNKVYNIEKNNTFCLTCLGNIYIERKDYEEAEKYLLAAIKVDKKNIMAHTALGDTSYAQSKFDDAIQRYLYAIKLGVSIPEIFLHLAHCYYIKEKFDLAINNYIEALKLVKNSRDDYYYYLGNALVAGGRLKDGIKAYQAAVKIKPNKLLYYYVLGRTCYLDKEYKHAIKYLEKYLDGSLKTTEEERNKICPENECSFLLFKCYSSLTNVDISKCKNIIIALMKKEPKNVKYIDCLAGLYEKTNQTLEAMQTYKKILKIEPNNAEAKTNLSRLEAGEASPKKKGKGKKHNK